ncbi:hypothetical protein PENANT_c070G06900 [Penicillium antarcticum]|uniref:DUF7703 domain-containing protein n=1 Tax=Penicillium antarcticum TaxID=416450 RepID=A0A1V6PQY5_9EURO|nr:hypothetical protein PENANT_c070G06900 [Penicillium antarcticum]
MSKLALDGVVGAYTGDDFTITVTAIAASTSGVLLSTVLEVIPQSVSFILKYYNLAPLWFSVTLSTVGWYFMVTGQAFVLYSRLNIIVPNLRVRHRVLAMIVANAILLHIPTTILTYGSNFVGAPIWIQGYKVMERIKLTGFCLQEQALVVERPLSSRASSRRTEIVRLVRDQEGYPGYDENSMRSHGFNFDARGLIIDRDAAAGS